MLLSLTFTQTEQKSLCYNNFWFDFWIIMNNHLFYFLLSYGKHTIGVAFALNFKSRLKSVMNGENFIVYSSTHTDWERFSYNAIGKCTAYACIGEAFLNISFFSVGWMRVKFVLIAQVMQEWVSKHDRNGDDDFHVTLEMDKHRRSSLEM